MEVSATQYDMLTSHADIVLFGGAAGGGKSHALLMDALRHAQGPYAEPLFRGVAFRKIHKQLTQGGGLIDLSRQLYMPVGGRFNQGVCEWTFRSGAKIGLSTLQHEKDIEKYLGSQYDLVLVDEAADFTEQNILFLWSRCRSKSGIKPRMRLSCNPDSSSYLYRWVYWYLDPQTGYPDTTKTGIIRHFVTDGELLVWSDDPVFDAAGDLISTSFTFIPSRLESNTHLLRSDPTYKKRLLALPESDRNRFLEGCWTTSSQKGVVWDGTYFIDSLIDEDDFPTPDSISGNGGVVRMFAIDPSIGAHARKGDFSAIVCLAQTQHLKFVDASVERRPPGTLVQDIFNFCESDLHQINGRDLIGIETISSQALFKDLIIAFARENPDYALSQYLAAGNPLIEISDSTNKMIRIQRLDMPIRQHIMRFCKNPGTSLLVQQLRSFTGIPAAGLHDDAIDALSMANNLPNYLREMRERQKAKR